MAGNALASPDTERERVVTLRLLDEATMRWRSPGAALVITSWRRRRIEAVRLELPAEWWAAEQRQGGLGRVNLGIARMLSDELAPVISPRHRTHGRAAWALVHADYDTPLYTAKAEATGEVVQGFLYLGQMEIGYVLVAVATDDDDGDAGAPADTKVAAA